ncbi:hypothetical protein KY285_010599 [Solanum tuberosum]|nr:hypothetical protein KY289_011144 [Solanum tuberosum]KAH0734892.1 hypothetical protein KY285_010599 [Solanum tuberosum]
MILQDGGQSSMGIGYQLSNSEFPSLPISSNSVSIKTNLPLEKSFAKSILVKEAESQHHDDLRKEFTIVGGIPQIKWTEEEVTKMNRIEKVQFVVVGKFTYEWSDLEELRKIIPQQCNVNGSCHIGLLRSKHILIRLTRQEDFVNLISKGAYYITSKDGYSYLMHTLIYDSKFKVQGHNKENCKVRMRRKEDHNYQHDKIEPQISLERQIPYGHQMQKGKAKILSSGKVVGDSGIWNIVRDKRVFAPQLTTRVENKFEGEQNNQSTKEWVATTFVTDLHVPVNVLYQLQPSNRELIVGEQIGKIAHQVDEKVRDMQEVDQQSPRVPFQSHEIVTDNNKQQHHGDKLCNNQASLVSTSREEEEEYSQLQEHCMALVEVPMAMQVDETKMIQIESPNRIAMGITEEEKFDDLLENIATKADLSPRIMKIVRKGKKQGSGDHSQPIRVQPKRSKTTYSQRHVLWDDIYQLAIGMHDPWFIGGDFNVVLNAEEKIGGLPVIAADYDDFENCISSCDLTEVKFKGSHFTWWNGRAGDDSIFERLDRILINQQMQGWFNHTEVEHLPRTGSDHAPLLFSCDVNKVKHKKPFKFLKFWTENNAFQDIVSQNWCTNDSQNPFLNIKENVKRVKSALTKWSREIYGDIFKQIIIGEDIVKFKEKLFDEFPTTTNREVLQRAQAEYKKYLHFEEIFWQQKAGYDWFENGDRSTRFFHSVVQGRRKKLHIQKIQNSQGNWLETEEDIATVTVSFYHNQFSQERDVSSFSLLRHIPEYISEEENLKLCRPPDLNEVKKVVFELNGDSASGPDGLTVPKKEQVREFTDLRSISLSNFINKILSRIVHNRVEILLPRLISCNQSGFVKGRSIIENVLLTQEIVSDIRKRGKPSNVLIKLDMAKAYDRAYEAQSGQKVNKDKSAFYVHRNAAT